MSVTHRQSLKVAVVDSQLEKKKLDSKGAAIAGVRMDVSQACTGVSGLLQKFINENHAAAWAKILN